MVFTRLLCDIYSEFIQQMTYTCKSPSWQLFHSVLGFSLVQCACISSLVPRPFERRRKGLVHSSIVTGCITVVTFMHFAWRAFLWTINGEHTVVSNYPTFFLGSQKKVHTVCTLQALSPPPLEGPGYETNVRPVVHRSPLLFKFNYLSSWGVAMYEPMID